MTSLSLRRFSPVDFPVHVLFNIHCMQYTHHDSLQILLLLLLLFLLELFSLFRLIRYGSTISISCFLSLNRRSITSILIFNSIENSIIRIISAHVHKLNACFDLHFKWIESVLNWLLWFTQLFDVFFCFHR